MSATLRHGILKSAGCISIAIGSRLQLQWQQKQPLFARRRFCTFTKCIFESNNNNNNSENKRSNSTNSNGIGNHSGTTNVSSCLAPARVSRTDFKADNGQFAVHKAICKSLPAYAPARIPRSNSKCQHHYIALPSAPPLTIKKPPAPTGVLHCAISEATAAKRRRQVQHKFQAFYSTEALNSVNTAAHTSSVSSTGAATSSTFSATCAPAETAASHTATEFKNRSPTGKFRSWLPLSIRRKLSDSDAEVASADETDQPEQLPTQQQWTHLPRGQLEQALLQLLSPGQDTASVGIAWVVGPTGVGKTHAAQYMVQQQKSAPEHKGGGTGCFVLSFGLKATANSSFEVLLLLLQRSLQKQLLEQHSRRMQYLSKTKTAAAPHFAALSGGWICEAVDAVFPSFKSSVVALLRHVAHTSQLKQQQSLQQSMELLQQQQQLHAKLKKGIQTHAVGTEAEKKVAALSATDSSYRENSICSSSNSKKKLQKKSSVPLFTLTGGGPVEMQRQAIKLLSVADALEASSHKKKVLPEWATVLQVLARVPSIAFQVGGDMQKQQKGHQPQKGEAIYADLQSVAFLLLRLAATHEENEAAAEQSFGDLTHYPTGQRWLEYFVALLNAYKTLMKIHLSLWIDDIEVLCLSRFLDRRGSEFLASLHRTFLSVQATFPLVLLCADSLTAIRGVCLQPTNTAAAPLLTTVATTSTKKTAEASSASEAEAGVTAASKTEDLQSRLVKVIEVTDLPKEEVLDILFPSIAALPAVAEAVYGAVGGNVALLSKVSQGLMKVNAQHWMDLKRPRATEQQQHEQRQKLDFDEHKEEGETSEDKTVRQLRDLQKEFCRVSLTQQLLLQDIRLFEWKMNRFLSLPLLEGLRERLQNEVHFLVSVFETTRYMLQKPYVLCENLLSIDNIVVLGILDSGLFTAHFSPPRVQVSNILYKHLLFDYMNCRYWALSAEQQASYNMNFLLNRDAIQFHVDRLSNASCAS